MNEEKVYIAARRVFEDSLSSHTVQNRLNAWQNRELKITPNASYLGIGEEIGELAQAVLELAAASGRLQHARLKADQGIRGYDDIEKLRHEAADAIADIGIFAMQLSTQLRLDFFTLILDTAEEVMKRRFASV